MALRETQWGRETHTWCGHTVHGAWHVEARAAVLPSNGHFERRVVLVVANVGGKLQPSHGLFEVVVEQVCGQAHRIWSGSGCCGGCGRCTR